MAILVQCCRWFPRISTFSCFVAILSVEFLLSMYFILFINISMCHWLASLIIRTFFRALALSFSFRPPLIPAHGFLFSSN